MKTAGELVTGSDFRRMITGAYHMFVYEHETINNLNVFPVPDGDTGTNMLLTLDAVSRAMAAAPSDSGVGILSKVAADSAILGARGNSGVILSQIFRGLARGLAGKVEADSTEIGKAFQYGVLYAYRALSQPVEGTILTVAKGIAKGTRRAVREGLSFHEILQEVIAVGEQELAKTPELLPALKLAGVVDAGGKGLIVFLRGCLEGLGGMYTGPETGFYYDAPAFSGTSSVNEVHPYCTEFIVKQCSVGTPEAKRILMAMGDSLILAEGSTGERLLKVHVHTGRPGAVLGAAITWGTLHDIKIDNMADQQAKWQHSFDKRKYFFSPPAKELGVISVAAGTGIIEIMREMGADIVLGGGQGMNSAPSVEDLLAAVHDGGARRYLLLPNNKNILLVAAQVKKLLADKVEVVSTLNVPQGLAALAVFDAAKGIHENLDNMVRCLLTVRAGSVTQAVRDSACLGYRVAEGRYIGMIDNAIIVEESNLGAALSGMVENLLISGSRLVTLYSGAAVEKNTAKSLTEELAETFPQVHFRCSYGGQPLYHFIIGVE